MGFCGFCGFCESIDTVTGCDSHKVAHTWELYAHAPPNLIMLLKMEVFVTDRNQSETRLLSVAWLSYEDFEYFNLKFSEENSKLSRL